MFPNPFKIVEDGMRVVAPVIVNPIVNPVRTIPRIIDEERERMLRERREREERDKRNEIERRNNQQIEECKTREVYINLDTFKFKCGICERNIEKCKEPLNFVCQEYDMIDGPLCKKYFEQYPDKKSVVKEKI